MKNKLRGRNFYELNYNGQKWLCGVAEDFEGTPWLIYPKSLEETLIKLGDYDEFVRKYNYNTGLESLDDNDLYNNIGNIQKYMEEIESYWFGDDWDGIIPVIKLSELEN